MPTTWDSLPKEILKIIFENLKEEIVHVADFELRECALVCRAWVSTAQEVIFSWIYLSDEEEFDSLIYTVASKPSLSRFVKSMEYEIDRFQPNKHHAHLAIIANFFSHLQELVTDGFCDDAFHELFFNLAKDGKFPRLKVLPKGYNKFQHKLQASYLTAFKNNSITKVELQRLDAYEVNNYMHLCDLLPQLSKLNKVEVIISSEDSQNAIEYIESSTRSATIREVHFSFDFPDNSTLSQLNNFQPVLNIKRLTSILLRELGIDIPNYILYLMKKFPNLEDLCLWFNKEWLVDSIEHDSAGDGPEAVFVNQLFEYLSRPLDYRIEFYYKDAAAVYQLFKLYFHYIPDREKSKTHLTICRRSNGDERSLTSIKLSRKAGKRHISVELCAQNYIRMAYSFLENFGHYLKSLQIGDINAFELVNGLNHISRYCINIKSLSLMGKSNMEYKNEAQNIYKSYSYLEKLTIQEFSPELFSFISLRFPCVETIVIEHKCHFENGKICKSNEEGDSNHAETNTITCFDMQDFSFQHLILDVSISQHYDDIYKDLTNNHFKNVYIKFCTQRDGQSRYIHLKSPRKVNDFREPLFKLVNGPTQAGFESSIGDPNYLLYEVKCGSVEKLSIIEHTSHDFELAVKVDILRNSKISIFNGCT